MFDHPGLVGHGWSWLRHVKSPEGHWKAEKKHHRHIIDIIVISYVAILYHKCAQKTKYRWCSFLRSFHWPACGVQLANYSLLTKSHGSSASPHTGWVAQVALLSGKRLQPATVHAKQTPNKVVLCRLSSRFSLPINPGLLVKKPFLMKL